MPSRRQTGADAALPDPHLPLKLLPAVINFYRELFFSCCSPSFLVMEQTDSCKCHHHTVFVAGLDYIVIPHRSSWLGNILYPALMSSLNIISKWEKASEPRVTSCIWLSHSLFSSLENTGGFSLKILCQDPSASTSICSSPI